MLQPDGDGALPVEEARAYAERHDIPMLTGDDLLEHYGKWDGESIGKNNGCGGL